METALLVLCSCGLGISKLRLAACALSLASMVGSTTGLTSDFGRGCCASQANPAALSPLGGPLPLILCLNPLFSGRKVVLIGFRASGLGLLEFLADEGTGSDGGAPNPIDAGMEWLLLRLRAGNVVDEEGRLEREAGGIVPPPSH